MIPRIPILKLREALDRPRVVGLWADIRPWVPWAHGAKVDMDWSLFDRVMAYGCCTAQDELELGSRVCAALCRENCRRRVVA